MSDDDHRPSWIDYWHAPHPNDPSWPSANPNWTKAEHQHGVGFYAPWEEVFAGFPEHARRCAVALAATRLPVHLRSSRGGMQFFVSKDLEAARAFEAMKKALEPLLMAQIKNYDAEIWQIVSEVSSFDRLGGPSHPWLDPEQLRLVYSRRVLSTVFERDRVSEDVVLCLNAVGQVWVANPHDKAMLERCGVKEGHVHVIPVPYFPDDPHMPLTQLPRVPGVPKFFHVGKWEPRKEHRNIVGAFLLAFEPGEAELYLKTSLRGPKLATDYPQSPQQCTSAWLADDRVRARGWTLDEFNRNVFVMQRRLSVSRLLQLYRQGDVYVTLSRGEGFDMPALAAIWSTVAPRKPASAKISWAASRMRASLRAWMRVLPGAPPASVAAGASCLIWGLPSLIRRRRCRAE